MKTKELISVILPVYNVEDYINKCIHSIVNQDYTNLEIILVDDGSKDSSGSICDRWAMLDNRIMVYHIDNHGVSHARNLGKEKSHGSWLTYVDPDDWLEESLYSKAMNRIIKDKSIDMLFWDYSRYEKKKKIRPNHFSSEKVDFYANDMIDVQCSILENDCHKNQSYYALRSPCTELIRRELALAADFPEDIYMGEDTCYILQCVSNASHIQYMNYPGYVYRIQEKSVVHSFQKKRGTATERLSMWIMEYARQSGNVRLLHASYLNHVHNIVAMLNYYVDFNLKGVINDKECDLFVYELQSSKYYYIVQKNIKSIRLRLKERLFLELLNSRQWKLLKIYKKIRLNSVMEHC